MIAGLPPNNRTVLYEMPTAWTRIGTAGEREIGLGTFRDVAALVDAEQGGANFPDLDVTQPNRSYLLELGVNAIELLPPADSFYVRQWGYGTTNFFAPDYELGYPADYSWPKASRSFCSCSLDRLVAMISNSASFIASTTLSMTASLVIRKSADVPSVTWLRTRLMKSSSMP